MLFPPLQPVEWLKNEILEWQRTTPSAGRFVRTSTRRTRRNLVDVPRSSKEEEKQVGTRPRVVVDL